MKMMVRGSRGRKAGATLEVIPRKYLVQERGRNPTDDWARGLTNVAGERDYRYGSSSARPAVQGITAAEIEAVLVPRYSPAAIRAGLNRMAQDGLITGNVSASEVRPERAYWNSLGVEPLAAEIGLCALGNHGQELIRHALSTNGLLISETAPFLLVTTDDYLRPELSQINLRQDPWLIAKPFGHTIWIGPLFVPGKTACWSCVVRWLKPHRWMQAAFYGWGNENFPPQPSNAWLQTTLAMAMGMIATTAAVWLRTGQTSELENAILSFDTRSLRLSKNLVRKWPHCPHCGSSMDGPKSRQRAMIEFLSPITGIVRMMQVTDKPVGGVFHAHATLVAPLPDSSRRQLAQASARVRQGENH
jgi:bacteriocin biosynthesis cyclodehydratase domain-containing protein